MSLKRTIVDQAAHNHCVGLKIGKTLMVPSYDYVKAHADQK